MTDQGAPFLSVEAVSLRFGGLQVLDGVSLSVAPGAALGIVGPNGAGKTSLLNCVSGVYRPDAGRVRIGNTVVNSMSPNRIARLGVARTFQAPQLVGDMSAIESVLVGRHIHMGNGLLGAVLGAGPNARAERSQAEIARQVLQSVGMAPWAATEVRSLPYGRQKLVELARALAAEPDLLLLDEPTAGLSSDERWASADLLKEVRRRYPSVAIMLIEHDLAFVTAVCDSIVVLDFGEVIAAGEPEAVMRDPRVVAAYLGTRRSAADHQAGAKI